MNAGTELQALLIVASTSHYCKRLNAGTELRLQDREIGQRCAVGWSGAATPTIKLEREEKCLSV